VELADDMVFEAIPIAEDFVDKLSQFRRASVMREQPGKQFGLGIGPIPGVMPDSRIFCIARVAPDLFNHFDHQPTALNRHRGVVRAVKSPYGYISDSICVTRIPATTNRDRGGELLRISY
jgi:hypothetical protein